MSRIAFNTLAKKAGIFNAAHCALGANVPLAQVQLWLIQMSKKEAS